MDSKKMIYGGMLIGGVVGSYLPLLWGGDAFSFSSVFLGALGGIFGIYLGFKLSR